MHEAPDSVPHWVCSNAASPGRALLPLCPAPKHPGLCMSDPDPARACAQVVGRLEAASGWRWGGESLVELWCQGQRSKQLRTRPQSREEIGGRRQDGV